MAKAKANQTVETTKSVAAFIKTVSDPGMQKDSSRLVDIMKEQTGFEAKMWGPGIIGFGTYHYKYESGREGDAPLVAFAPRKSTIALYLGCEAETKAEMAAKLGKHKMSGGCIHIKKLDDIDSKVLGKMIKLSMQYYKKKYK